ncbi:MAG: carbamate kinase [Clostridia bacterium]|nr:MAG: carbamate kinase [Clostridia bacterium]
MGKRIVIALGGNALGKNLHEQMDAVHVTAKAIADLIQDGHEVVIAHGNGPQVGMIQNAFAAYHKQEAKSDIMPLSMCVAMSQGYIGYDLQNVIGEELDRRGAHTHVATVLTQVAVDPKDPAFQHPTKPIGAFMTEEEAKKLAAEKGIDVAEDAGRGWRQVVASPKPTEIIEIATIRALMNDGHAVIAAGGGGIPVIWEDKYHLKGVPAVIDKDFASECMAEQLDADMLIILTAVEKVAVNFGKPDQRGLDELTPEEARRYIAEGQFAPGSMLPKVEAAVKFAESKPGRKALITLLEKARDGIAGKTGTVIHQ